MRKDHTEIVCIIDRSGSMAAIKNDAIGGFNTFIDNQKKLPGTASVTLVLFNDMCQTLYDNIAIDKVNQLASDNYIPACTTALLDAIGTTIDSIGKRLSMTPENDRPGKVIICILTDGQENASVSYSKSRIKEMIEHQRDKYAWEFCYLGANQDSFSEAGKIGIARGMTANFVPDSMGTQCAYSAMNLMATKYRQN